MKNTEIKKKKGKLVAGFFSLFAIIVLLLLAISVGFNHTFSWFAANREVTGDGMQVKVDGDSFELDIHNDPRTYDLNNHITSYLHDEKGYNETNTLTSAGAPKFFCNLKIEGPETDATKIEPGSWGYVEFDIIPKKAGNHIYTINIDYEGLVDGETQNTYSFVSDITALTLLKGHVLLFQDRTDNPNGSHYYLNRINESFTYSTLAHTADKTVINGEDHYHVKIYWVWALSVSQLLLSEGDINLSVNPLFSAGAQERIDLINYISGNDGTETNHESEYFYSSIADPIDFSSFSTSHKTGDYYFKLSSQYNNADQYIGDEIRYLVLEMSVLENN